MTLSPAALEETNCCVCGPGKARPFARAKSHYSGDVFALEACASCGLIFVNPRLPVSEVTETYKHMAVDADTDNEFPNRSDVISERLTLRWIRRYQPSGRILDFGCGYGSFMRAAIAAGFQAVGIELSSRRAEAARRIFGLDVRTGTIDEESRFEVLFDAVHANQVFEHLPAPDKMLRQLHRLMNPGGAIALSVPNIRCYSERLRPGSTYDPTAHLHYFSASTLRRLLEKNGFEPVARFSGVSLTRLWCRLFRSDALALRLSLWTERLTSWTNLGMTVTIVARKGAL